MKHPLFWIALIALIVGGITFANSRSSAPEVGADTAATEAAAATVVEYQGRDGMSVLALLKETAEVTTEQSSLGEYVTGINEIESGTDGKYWLFFVNDTPATVGAAEYVTKDGDTVRWSLE